MAAPPPETASQAAGAAAGQLLPRVDISDKATRGQTRSRREQGAKLEAGGRTARRGARRFERQTRRPYLTCRKRTTSERAGRRVGERSACCRAQLAAAGVLLPRRVLRREKQFVATGALTEIRAETEIPLAGGVWRRTAARGGGGTYVVTLHAIKQSVGAAASAMRRRL